MREWRRVRDGDRGTVLRVLARHGVRTYEGFPLAGLSDDELRDVYATYMATKWRRERGDARGRTAEAAAYVRQTQVSP